MTLSLVFFDGHAWWKEWQPSWIEIISQHGYSCIPVTHIHTLDMCSPGRPLYIKSALLMCQVTYKIQINVHIEPFDYIKCGVYYTGQIKIDW